MAITSANQLELLQTAEAVAREKMIDPGLVVEAMEESLARAAKSRYGAEMDRVIYVKVPAGVELQGVKPGQLIRLRRSVYGLNTAPLAWFRRTTTRACRCPRRWSTVTPLWWRCCLRRERNAPLHVTR